MTHGSTPAPELPPVLRLLLACLGAPLTETGDETIRRLWRHMDAAPAEVVEAALQHHVAERVWQRLRQLPPGLVPSGAEARFREAHHINAIRSLGAMRDHLQIEAALAAASIRVMPFKGVVLGQMLHGDPAWRNQGDLDMLVAPGDVAAASAVLSRLGYRSQLPLEGLDPARLGLIRLIQKDLTFVREGALPQAVELHWRLIHNPRMFTTDFDALWARGRTVALGPRQVRTLSDEDLLVYLCAHGSSTAWFRLKWLADLAPFLARVPVDWDIVAARSRAWNCEKAVGLGLQLAERWFDVPLPPPAQALTATVRPADLAFVAEALTSPASWWHTDGRRRVPPRTLGFVLRFWRYMLNLGHGWRYRFEGLVPVLFDVGQVARHRLPRALFALYIPMRLGHWIGRALGRLWRRG